MSRATELVLERARALAQPGPVPSPCTAVCRIDPCTDICRGCFRSLDEIAAWGNASDEEKRVIWDRLLQRASQP